LSIVNALKLCGFNDWRLPTAEELHGLVDYGLEATAPLISGVFANTAQGVYHSSTPQSGVSVWSVNFEFGNLATTTNSTPAYVRLVRGAPWTGQRYITTSLTYPSDGANNAVIDRRTGLTWRRCVEGQTWNGSACSGSGVNYNHADALIRARGRTGWRLPNIKERSSLSDFGVVSTALDPLYFPGAPTGYNWTTTPFLFNSTGAWRVNASTGGVGTQSRTTEHQIRLVSSNP
jgi:hypothetical protein